MSEPIPPQRYMPMLCSVYNHPLFRVVGDGLDIRCRHCKGIHHYSRRKLERMWDELKQAMEENAILEEKAGDIV